MSESPRVFLESRGQQNPPPAVQKAQWNGRVLHFIKEGWSYVVQKVSECFRAVLVWLGIVAPEPQPVEPESKVDLRFAIQGDRIIIVTDDRDGLQQLVEDAFRFSLERPGYEGKIGIYLKATDNCKPIMHLGFQPVLPSVLSAALQNIPPVLFVLNNGVVPLWKAIIQTQNPVEKERIYGVFTRINAVIVDRALKKTSPLPSLPPPPPEPASRIEDGRIVIAERAMKNTPRQNCQLMRKLFNKYKNDNGLPKYPIVISVPQSRLLKAIDSGFLPDISQKDEPIVLCTLNEEAMRIWEKIIDKDKEGYTELAAWSAPFKAQISPEAVSSTPPVEESKGELPKIETKKIESKTVEKEELEPLYVEGADVVVRCEKIGEDHEANCVLIEQAMRYRLKEKLRGGIIIYLPFEDLQSLRDAKNQRRVLTFAGLGFMIENHTPYLKGRMQEEPFGIWLKKAQNKINLTQAKARISLWCKRTAEEIVTTIQECSPEQLRQIGDFITTNGKSDST